MQLRSIKPNDLTIAAISVLIATQVIDFRRRTTLISPVIGVVGICGNAIVSRSASEHKRRVGRANVRNLRNNLLAGKAVTGSKLHTRKIGYAAQANRRAPAFSGNSRAVFNRTFVFDGHPIDIGNAPVVNAARNTTEPLA